MDEDVLLLQRGQARVIHVLRDASIAIHAIAIPTPPSIAAVVQVPVVKRSQAVYDITLVGQAKRAFLGFITTFNTVPDPLFLVDGSYKDAAVITAETSRSTVGSTAKVGVIKPHLKQVSFLTSRGQHACAYRGSQQCI